MLPSGELGSGELSGDSSWDSSELVSEALGGGTAGGPTKVGRKLDRNASALRVLVIVV